MHKKLLLAFNPRIIKESKDEVVMEEGCLSYPELFLEISRPSTIVVKYEDEGKQMQKRQLTGYYARIFQHMNMIIWKKLILLKRCGRIDITTALIESVEKKQSMVTP